MSLGVSRTGRHYAAIGRLHLNSPYDPEREARRFLTARSKPSPTAVVVLGDTLPYLRRELERLHPTKRILSVYYDENLLRAARESSSPPPLQDTWSPHSASDLPVFLRSRLSAEELEGLLVLEWPPSATAFPEQSKTASGSVRQLMRETAGQWSSEFAFARSWLHNLFANYLTIDAWYAIRPQHIPAVIAASGPSLERSLSLLARFRRRILLIALPSSIAAIDAAGLSPDLVVSVDGGYWAQAHLALIPPRVPVAMPLIGARGVWRGDRMPVLLSAHSAIEEELISAAGLPAYDAFTTATVAASAYELACRLSSGPIVFAGLDLCADGLLAHVRPHTFDNYLALRTSRRSPLPTILADRRYPRQGSASPNAALETYAGWFSSLTSRRPLYRLYPSPVAVNNLRPLDAASFGSLLASCPPVSIPEPIAVSSTARGQREAVVNRLTASWEERLSGSGALSPAQTERLLVEHGALLRSLAPRALFRLRQARSGRSEASRRRLADELLEEARAVVAEARRRYLG